MAALVQRIANLYRGAAILLLNTCLFFVLLNVVLFLASGLKQAFTRPALPSDPAESVYAELYPGRDRGEIAAIWAEVGRPLVYEPFAEFGEARRTGKYVNVAGAGFRLVENQGPWPPAPDSFNVFVFGGSTTFGYGVPDGDAWPSRFQELLRRRFERACVYNFGRGYYYSPQERVLFERLLTSGHVPQMAVFLDGLNDFAIPKDETAASARFAAALAGAGGPDSWLELTLARLPLGRAIRYTQRALGLADAPPAAEAYDDEAVLEHVIGRYLANKKLTEAAARGFGVVPVFAWQPVPTYRFDVRRHPFAAKGFDVHARSAFGYAAVEKRRGSIAGNFIWLADIQERVDGPLYIDLIHYSPKLHRELAAALDARLEESGVYSAAMRASVEKEQ